MDIEITEIYDEDKNPKNDNLSKNTTSLALWRNYENFKLKLQNHNKSLKQLTSRILNLSVFKAPKLNPVRSNYSKNKKLKNVPRTRCSGKTRDEWLVLKKLLVINLRSFRVMQLLHEENYDLQKLIDKTYRLTVAKKQHYKELENKDTRFLGREVRLSLKNLDIAEKPGNEDFHMRLCNIPTKQNSMALLPVQTSNNQFYVIFKLVQFCDNLIRNNNDFQTEPKRLKINVDLENSFDSLHKNSLLVNLQNCWFPDASETCLRFNFEEIRCVETESENLSLQEQVANSIANKAEVPSLREFLIAFEFTVIESKSIHEVPNFLLHENDKNTSIDFSEEELKDDVFYDYSSDLSDNASNSFVRCNTKTRFSTKRKKPLTLKTMHEKLLKRIRKMKRRRSDSQLGRSISSKDQGSQTDCRLEQPKTCPRTNQTRVKQSVVTNRSKDSTSDTARPKNNSSDDFRKSLKCLQEIIDFCSDSSRQDVVVPAARSQKRKKADTKNIASKTQTKEQNFFREHRKRNYKDAHGMPEMNKLHQIILESRSPRGVDLKFVSVDKPSVSKIFIGSPPKRF